MRIITVDDMRHALRSTQQAIEAVCPDAEVIGFTSAKEALEYAGENRVDVAFLDIHMGEMNGLFLAKHLKEIYGKMNIIFVTAYSQYMGDAIALRASGYVMKPINPDHVKDELNNLRNPVKTPDKGLRVQCFGNFEVFMDGEPLRFPRSKSKELLAYLVHRNGASCTMRELIAVLFEDNAEANVRPYVSALIKTLDDTGVKRVVVKDYNSIRVDISKFDCDLYGYLNMDAEAVNLYKGEYMAQYSWPEFMIGVLDDRKA